MRQKEYNINFNRGLPSRAAVGAYYVEQACSSRRIRSEVGAVLRICVHSIDQQPFCTESLTSSAGLAGRYGYLGAEN